MRRGDGRQLKIRFPQHLYDALLEESNDAGVTMASLVRIAVKDRYSSVDEDQPVPFRLTEKGLAANGSK